LAEDLESALVAILGPGNYTAFNAREKQQRRPRLGRSLQPALAGFLSRCPFRPLFCTCLNEGRNETGYRGIYIVGDQQVGQRSKPVRVTVGG